MNEFDAAGSIRPALCSGSSQRSGGRTASAAGWTSRASASPGQPERRFDSVVALERIDGSGPPFALNGEAQSRPDPRIFERVLAHLLRVRDEQPFQLDPLVLYDIGGYVVNLTGRQANADWTIDPPGLSGIDYGLVAAQFAGLTKAEQEWKKTLEGWGLEKSPFLAEMATKAQPYSKSLGAIDESRQSILTVLETRFPDGVTAHLRGRLDAEVKLDALRRWVVSAATAKSMEEFVASIVTRRPVASGGTVRYVAE